RTGMGSRRARAVAPPARRAGCRRTPHAHGRRAAQPDAHRPPADGRRPVAPRRDRPVSDVHGVSPTLGALLEGEPDDGVVYLGEVGTTRAELVALVDTFTSALREAGLDRRAIGVLGANAPATIAAWFAVWNVGGAFVPLNPR